MTIIRDGKTIELTDEEIRSIVADSHREDVRYEYEDAVARCEEEGWISFASYASCEFGEYESEADAREDFIDKLTDDYLEDEDLYERNPHDFHNHDFDDDVMDFAEDLEYITEEGANQ